MIIKKGWFSLSDSIKVDLSMNVLFSGIGCQERGFENMVLLGKGISSQSNNYR